MRNVNLQSLCDYNINPFLPIFTFIYLLITENLMFSDVFSGYGNIALKTTGLIKVIVLVTLLPGWLDKIKAILFISQSMPVTIQKML